jgi:gliding motility-associated-like protein
LSFDTKTGTISGTPTSVSPATDYVITAYNISGSNTTIINIKVNATIDPPSITYSTPQTYTIGTPITSLSPANTGGDVPINGYTVDKPLSAGLTLDPNTGIISGTPTAASTATYYTITARNAAGSSSFVINMGVNLKSSIITFPTIPQNHADANNNITPTASSTNTEVPIIYTTSDPTIATITANGLIHLISPGLVRIIATQAGNANYNPAEPVSQDLRITQQQQLFLPPIATKTTCDADFQANAISNSVAKPPYPIIYTSSNPGVASITDQGLIHITGLGQCTITINQNGDGIYYLAAPSQSQTFTVIAPSVAAITISPASSSICEASSVTYTATVTNPGTNPVYQWQVNGINISGATGNTFTNTALHNNDKITCNYTSTDICNNRPTTNSNAASITVDPYVTPAVNITASAGQVCSGAALTFTAIGVNGGGSATYQWQVNGVNAGNNSNTFTTSTLHNGDAITCILINQGGKCLTANNAVSNAVIAHVILNVTPAITITASSTKIFEGMSVAFNAVSNAGTGASYQWAVNGTATGTNNTLYTSRLLKNGDVVTCTVVGTAACILPVTSEPVTIIVNPAVDIPVNNTITPNGDGINDVWNIPTLVYYPANVVDIYNRFGMPVFHSNGYGTPWDGTTNARPLPVGTYYFLINLGYNDQRVSGSVTIIR